MLVKNWYYKMRQNKNYYDSLTKKQRITFDKHLKIESEKND